MDKRDLVMRISVVLLVPSFIAGPAYYFYCSYVAGSKVGSHALHPEPAGPKGLRAFKPVVLDLDPAMNPLRFVVRMNVHQTGIHFEPPRIDYQATLLQGERRLWRDSFSMGGDKEESGSNYTWKSLDTFEVTRSGQYRLMVEEVSKQGRGLSVSSAEVAVKRNTLAPQKPIVIVGTIAAVLSFVVLWIAILWPSIFPSQAEKEERERVYRQLREAQPLVGTLMDFMKPPAGGTGTMLFVLVVLLVTVLLFYWNQGQG